MQSGKPVGIFRTHPGAPRVLIANALLVPAWATWETFRDLEHKGLTMYGQMTAGSWIYIGTQGILQGTYETLASVAAAHFGGSLAGRVFVTAGLGGMGGAQPLAATMNGAPRSSSRWIRTASSGACRRATWTRRPTSSTRRSRTVDAWRRDEARRGRSRCCGNAADVLPALVARGVTPDVLTDQTSAHDALNGYVPERHDARRGRRAARATTPTSTSRRSVAAMAAHVRAMLALQRRGAVTFDYGNNIRAQAVQAGVAERVRHPGLRARVHPAAVLRGQGAVPLGRALGRSRRHPRRPTTPRSRCSRDDAALCRWIRLARERVAFQGLPARIFWLGYGERARFGLRINELVRAGRITAPIVIGRDHLDTGSVASPNRETEAMRDGSDAIADWPILNALLNASCGRDLGVGAPRRRRRHRLLAARRHGDRRRRHAARPTRSCSAC